MPYSSSFFNSCFRRTSMSISFKPTSPFPFSTRFTPWIPHLFTRRNISMGFVNLHHSRPASVSGDVSCSTTQFKWVEVALKEKQQDHVKGFKQRNVAFPFWQHQSCYNYGRFAYDYLSSDDSDVEFGSPQAQRSSSTLDNVDEWRWKLTMLLRNNDEVEVVSRERNDRRDFEQLSALATRMGLHSRQYAKVVVFSKDPLPNYRPDLDDKRLRREVVLPFGLQRAVEGHLRLYQSSHKSVSRECLPNRYLQKSGIAANFANKNGPFEHQEPSTTQSIVMEKTLCHKSLQLRNQQQDWQA